MDYVDVIGDKKGGTTTYMLRRQPREWSHVFNIKSLNLTIKVILVYRNPYDIVASTVLLAHYSKSNFAIIKKANITSSYSPEARSG